MKHEIGPDEYEQALHEKLLYEFPPQACRVIWNDRSVMGRHSKVRRQLDVAVYRAEQGHPFIVGEARLWGRRVSVEVVDGFIGKLDDIGPETIIGLLVSLKGFSKGARRRATSSGIRVLPLSVEEALELNMRRIAREVYPRDWAFHQELAAALLGLERKNDAEKIVEKIEKVPYDEWLAFVQYGLEHHPQEASHFLRFVALNYPDDGWRFNAVQRLIDSGSLSQPDADRIVSQETDPEIIQLLTGSGLAST